MAENLGGPRLLSSPTKLLAPLACALRQQIPGPVMVVTNANGWTGYWPRKSAFVEGGYEIDATRAMGRSAGDSEVLIEHLVKLAGRI